MEGSESSSYGYLLSIFHDWIMFRCYEQNRDYIVSGQSRAAYGKTRTTGEKIQRFLQQSLTNKKVAILESKSNWISCGIKFI
jgi:hypothetical protein